MLSAFLLLLPGAASAADPQTVAVATVSLGSYSFGSWATSAVLVGLACVPGVSDCASISYCTDAANACDPAAGGAEYGGPISISGEGTTYVRYASNSSAGAWGDTGSSMVKIDSIAPAISLSDDASTGWVQSDTLSVSASDSGSGLLGVKWALRADSACGTGQDGELDSGSNGTSILANNDSAHQGKYACFRAQDAAGNRNYTVSSQIARLDTTAPSVDAGGNAQANSPFTQNATASDSGSGLSSYSWSKSSGPGSIYFGSSGSIATTVSADADGTYNISLSAADAAGNSASDSFLLSWDRSAPAISVANPGGAAARFKLLSASSSEGTLMMAFAGNQSCNSSLTFAAYAPLNFSSDADNGRQVCYMAVDALGNTVFALSDAISGVVPARPEITLLGEPSATVEVHSGYSDAGATASDNYDGDITANLTVESTVNTSTLGNYTVAYSVVDSSGAAASAIRAVRVVDTTPPAITLLGNSTVKVEINSQYADAGATASDNYDGDLASKLASSGHVNTAIEGTYLLTYYVEDSSGNKAAQATRTVVVGNSLMPILTGIGALALLAILAGAAYVLFFNKKRRGL
jgi:hypothetical protein